MATWSTLEGWEGWEGWRPGSPGAGAARADWLARQRSRDAIVFGQAPAGLLRAKTAGHPLAGLSAYARRQLVGLDMLAGLTVDEQDAAGMVAIRGPRGVPAILV